MSSCRLQKKISKYMNSVEKLNLIKMYGSLNPQNNDPKCPTNHFQLWKFIQLVIRFGPILSKIDSQFWIWPQYVHQRLESIFHEIWDQSIFWFCEPRTESSSGKASCHSKTLKLNTLSISKAQYATHSNDLNHPKRKPERNITKHVSHTPAN